MRSAISRRHSRSRICSALLAFGAAGAGFLRAQSDVILNTAVTTAQTTTATMSVNLAPGFSAHGTNGTFRSFIDYNQNNVSDYAESLTAATPTYWTGFEAADGFTLGSLNGQGGWYGGPDAPQVVNSDSFDGAWSVTFPARNPINTLKRYFNPTPGSTVTFLDFASRPGAGAINFSTTFDFGASQVAFVGTGSTAQVQVFNGNGSGGGSWTAVGSSYALSSSQSTEWIRFTVRVDYTAKKWDLYLNGQLTAFDQGFVANGYVSLPYLIIYGSTTGATAFDYPWVSALNPLFVDNDQDGMDDAWESSHGANPANPGDRNSTNGASTNIQVFQAGAPSYSSVAHNGSLEVFTPLP
jgi:hypothetical protein